MKKCSKCKQLLADDMFSRDSRALDTLQSNCKMCKNTYQKVLYHTNSEKRLNTLSRNRAYRKYEVSRYRREWRGSTGFIGLTSFRFEIASKAEELAYTIILPNEGFTDIVWLNNHHAPFDMLAMKDNQRYSIDVTIAPYKHYGASGQSSGNQKALNWLCRNLALRHVILFISPDLTKYVFKEMVTTARCVSLAKKDIAQAIQITAHNSKNR